MIILLIAAIIWFLLGACGFIFWWTRDYEFTSFEAPFAFCAGFTGPLAWAIGYAIHGKKRTKIV